LTLRGVVAEIFCLCIGVHVHVCVYVRACMRVYVHVHMYVYVYMCVCVYVRIYMYMHTRVGVHMYSCRRILFICTVPFLYYMRVYHWCFSTPACVCGGGLEVGFFSTCSWLALIAGVGGYVLTGVEIGVLSCMCFYFCGC